MRTLTTVALVLGLSTQAGCFGKFRLSQKVLEFNDGLSDSMAVKELAFILMIAVPVYEVALVADALIFNTVEWASGSNPIASHRSLELDGGTVAFARTERGVVVAITRDGVTEERTFRRTSGTWEVVDGAGQRVALLREGPDGSVEVVGPDDEPLASWTADQVDWVIAQAAAGGLPGAIAAVRTSAYGGPMQIAAH